MVFRSLLRILKRKLTYHIRQLPWVCSISMKYNWTGCQGFSVWIRNVLINSDVSNGSLSHYMIFFKILISTTKLQSSLNCLEIAYFLNFSNSFLKNDYFWLLLLLAGTLDLLLVLQRKLIKFIINLHQSEILFPGIFYFKLIYHHIILTVVNFFVLVVDEFSTKKLRVCTTVPVSVRETQLHLGKWSVVLCCLSDVQKYTWILGKRTLIFKFSLVSESFLIKVIRL